MTQRYSTGHTTPEDIAHYKAKKAEYWKRWKQKKQLREQPPSL